MGSASDGRTATMVFDSWARWIESWAKPLTRVMSSMGAAFLCLMMFWVVADVVMRFLFNHPILGSYEVVEYGMVFFVFLAFAFAQFNRAHICVPVVVERLSPRARAAVDVVTGIIAVLITAGMAWGALIQTQSMYNTHITSSVLFIPKWPFQLVTAIGLAIFIIAKFAEVLERLAVAVAGPAAAVAVEESDELRVT
jgi:TRAP-type transport system small permease protein